MLVIRHAQMQAFSLAAIRQFERRALEHVRGCFPGSYEALGEEGARASISWGVEKARGYGLSEEYDVLRFINLMFALGFDFDEDPAYAWAAEILRDPDWSPGARMDMLTARAIEGPAPDAGDAGEEEF